MKQEKEIRHQDSICTNESQLRHKWYHNLKYMIVGILFGIIFVKAEIISWFRIQEMFRLQSFHMYGVIGSAVLTGMIAVLIIKKFNIKTIYGEKISIAPKKFNKGQIYGGLIFGFGWAITGACPGPLFAQIGTGAFAVAITLLSAIFGTWMYGYFREKLPH
ncbi:YeeE/YedE thiosulfate transporter family protein [Chryseobacterium gambrini]|uniref:YeeE/YedE thiosulfate transporter family protein n=1 Tax=Chryseobacterium gambrini TaxID=373672 RepID=A0AAJ1VJ64_9FLAO|nr:MULTISPECIES: DUF6691 family protein [Chryseobacterium]MDN4012650.1 YeeE/YedE thiosulfate transporter family protein [Chryseobacterium gambrini]MDN4030245.1 YeeE/YedE thiosulfate transporter family protein [Chryseobacterium gambrini]QWA38541.1 YeeE/YedE family protein [Chryseobacterium sp. ZHDP1]